MRFSKQSLQRRFALSVLAAALVSGCGSGGDSQTPPPTATPKLSAPSVAPIAAYPLEDVGRGSSSLAFVADNFVAPNGTETRLMLYRAESGWFVSEPNSLPNSSNCALYVRGGLYGFYLSGSNWISRTCGLGNFFVDRPMFPVVYTDPLVTSGLADPVPASFSFSQTYDGEVLGAAHILNGDNASVMLQQSRNGQWSGLQEKITTAIKPGPLGISVRVKRGAFGDLFEFVRPAPFVEDHDFAFRLKGTTEMSRFDGYKTTSKTPGPFDVLIAKLEANGDLTYIRGRGPAQVGTPPFPATFEWRRLQTNGSELLFSRDGEGSDSIVAAIRPDATKVMLWSSKDRTEILEGTVAGEMQPAAWNASSSERARCKINEVAYFRHLKCRAFNWPHATTVATLDFDEFSKSATLYVSRRTPSGSWSSVASSDLSSLIEGTVRARFVQLDGVRTVNGIDYIYGTVSREGSIGDRPFVITLGY